MSNPKPNHTCEVCGTKFYAKRSDAKSCSTKCRMLKHFLAKSTAKRAKGGAQRRRKTTSTSKGKGKSQESPLR